MTSLRSYEWILVEFFVYLMSLALVLRRPAGLAHAA